MSRKSLLIFLDGSTCDTRGREPGPVTAAVIEADRPVPGSAAALSELAIRYDLVYLGARPTETIAGTRRWLDSNGFPPGPVHADETHAGRMSIVRRLAAEGDYIAGIGDRWDDNAYHNELGCLSIILKEYEGDWPGVPERILRHHKAEKVRENEAALRGKIEGLARVLPLLEARYGPDLWENWMQAVLKMAEEGRPALREEYLAAFAEHGLDPADLRSAARLDDLDRQDWEHNPVYGLQDFELVEASPRRYAHKVTRCRYAELWQQHGRPDIGYQIHCRTDRAWWDHPAWNPAVRFEQPCTLMQGGEYCLFVQWVEEVTSDWGSGGTTTQTGSGDT